MKTLVIGASENTSRYSNMIMKLLHERNEPVIGIGRHEGMVENAEIKKGLPDIKNVHTVTMYVSEKYQPGYEDYILNIIKPKRIIFNPGAENWPLFKRAKAQNIEAINACTLVMIKTGQYFDISETVQD